MVEHGSAGTRMSGSGRRRKGSPVRKGVKVRKNSITVGGKGETRDVRKKKSGARGGVIRRMVKCLRWGDPITSERGGRGSSGMGGNPGGKVFFLRELGQGGCRDMAKRVKF